MPEYRGLRWTGNLGGGFLESCSVELALTSPVQPHLGGVEFHRIVKELRMFSGRTDYWRKAVSVIPRETHKEIQRPDKWTIYQK